MSPSLYTSGAWLYHCYLLVYCPRMYTNGLSIFLVTGWKLVGVSCFSSDILMFGMAETMCSDIRPPQAL